MTIAACIIVRDAEDVLQRCINSLAAICDELCILDTGSKDASPQIASKVADRFDVYTKCNDADGRIADFSDARNKCLGMAESKWILIVDADEVFHNHSNIALSDAISDDVNGAALAVRRGSSKWMSIRLFRNDPAHRFKYRVHEVVTVKHPIQILEHFEIVDRGQQQKPEESTARNIRLCGLMLEENPDEMRAYFYRAQAHLSQRSFECAVKDYLAFLACKHLEPSFKVAAQEGLATSYLYLEDWSSAVDVATKVIETHPQLAESYCILGDAYLGLHDIESAERYYGQATSLSCPPSDYGHYVKQTSYDEYPRKQLQRIRSLKERYDL